MVARALGWCQGPWCVLLTGMGGVRPGLMGLVFSYNASRPNREILVSAPGHCPGTTLVVALRWCQGPLGAGVHRRRVGVAAWVPVHSLRLHLRGRPQSTCTSGGTQWMRGSTT